MRTNPPSCVAALASKLVIGLIVSLAAVSARAQDCTWLESVFPNANLGSSCPCSAMPVFSNFNICSTGSYNLVFCDEFSGSTLSSDKWLTYYPYDGTDQTQYARTHGSGENQVYLDENVVVHDGMVSLVTKAESYNWLGAQKDYTSGMLYSKNQYRFNRGKFVIKARLPDTQTSELIWPAFWLFGDSPSNPVVGDSELDGFEFCSGNWGDLKSSLHHLHWCSESIPTPISHDTQHGSVSNITNGWHIFEIEWDFFFIRIYVDGVLKVTHNALITMNGVSVNDANCNIGGGTYFTQPQFPDWNAYLNVVLNTAVSQNGAFCSGSMTDAELPVSFDIDYVRVYERNDNDPQSGLPDLSQQSRWITGDYMYVCEGSTRTYHLSGCHGDLVWEVSPNLQILASSPSEITVTNATPLNTGSGWVRVTDPNPPCGAPNQLFELPIWVGPPEFTVTEITPYCAPSFNLACNSDFDDYTPAEYTFSVDQNVIQAQSFSQMLNNNYATLENDFCHEYTIIAHNWLCGDYTVNGTIRDNCILGPCDIAGPGGPSGFEVEVKVSPSPASTEFWITISSDVDLSIITQLEVMGMNNEVKFVRFGVQENAIHVPCADWAPGIYLVRFRLMNEYVSVRVQVKD